MGYSGMTEALTRNHRNRTHDESPAAICGRRGACRPEASPRLHAPAVPQPCGFRPAPGHGSPLRGTRNDTKKWIVHFAFTAESSEEMFLRPSVSAEGRFRVRA